MVAVFGGIYGFDEDTVYLSPAPLYHAAPLRYVGIVGATGGTAVIMPRFDPEQALINIEKFKVTQSQWVQTMFVRLLKLPDAVREKYDISSLKNHTPAAAQAPNEGIGKR